MKESFLTVQNINVKYGDTQVIWDLSFSLEKGQITSLIGSNGAGKSTTINAAAGLISPFKGKIFFEGEDITNKSCAEFIDRGIILCPEGRQLFPNMTVYENLELGACTTESKKKKKNTLEQIYNWFPILKERQKQLAGTLSGGEQQMVAFSRGMMGLPKVLLMDEPSLGLAPKIVDEIFKIAKNVSSTNGLSIAIAEQDARKALSLASNGYVIENGVVNVKGNSEYLLNNEDVKKAYLGF